MQNQRPYYASILILRPNLSTLFSTAVPDSPLASMWHCACTNQGGGGRAVEIIIYI